MKRKLLNSSESSSSSSNNDDLDYLLKKPYNKPPKKFSKKTNYIISKYNHDSSPSSSSSEEEESKKKKKKKKSNLKELLYSMEKSNNKMNLGGFINVNDNIVTIDEIYKSKDEYPRADGLVFDDPKWNKIYPERYGRDWIKQLTEKETILQNDLNYKFLLLIAGKIETDVWSLLHDQNLEEVIKKNQQIFETIRKERERIIVPSEKKREQIEIMENVIEKDQLKYNKYNTMLLHNLKILNRGQLLIDSGKNKDIPDKLHDQGLLYILKLEDDFSSFIDLLDAFGLTKPKYIDKADTTYHEKLKLMNVKIKEIIKEIYNEDIIKIDYNDQIKGNIIIKNHEQLEYIYYNILLFFKYFLNCMYKENDTYQPPKIHILKRFKYLINLKREYGEDDIDILTLKIDDNFDKDKDSSQLNKKIKELLNEYNFNATEKSTFNNLKSGHPNLIDLINTTYKTLPNTITDGRLIQIFRIDWDLIYGHELVNLRNFYILFTPFYDLTQTFDNTTNINFFSVFFRIAKIGCNNDTIYENILEKYINDDKYNIVEDNGDINILKGKNQKIYDLIRKINYTHNTLNLTMVFISHIIYNFFIRNYDRIFDFLNIYYGTFPKGIFLDTFYTYYKMVTNIGPINTVPFIIDSTLIRYMKQLYYITLNDYYLYDIVKILHDDNIINFPSDIINIINRNSSIKLDASFYRILNESMTNIEIKVIDPSFQQFLDSFSSNNIKRKEEKAKQLKTPGHIDHLIYLLNIPTKSLNINKKYQGYSPIINLHIYYNLYVEYLKSTLNEIKTTISRSEKAINKAKTIISRIASEKIDIKKIEDNFRDTYQNPLEWVTKPFNSGVLIIRENIIAAITDAFYKVKNNSTNLKDITLPVIILAHESGLTIEFVTLVSYIIKQQRMNSPVQYYKVTEISYNFKDLTKKVMAILNNYRFKKSNSIDNKNGFLGTIYFKNKAYPIRYDVSGSSNSISSNIATI